MTSKYLQDRAALFSSSSGSNKSAPPTNDGIVCGEGSSAIIINKPTQKSYAFFFKRGNCLVVPPKSAASMPVGDEYHFFVNEHVYVVTKEAAKGIVSDPNAPARVSTGDITDVDAAKHGKAYTYDEYRVAYASILLEKTPVGFGFL